MEGTSKTSNGYSYEGEVSYYHKNGLIKAVTNYINGNVSGKDVEWYENGTKKLEGENIVMDKKGNTQLKMNQFWDINGVQKVVDGNGFFEDNEDDESSKGEIKNGFKEGVWESYSKKANWTYKENFKEGKLISGESWGENKIINNYTELEIRPEPKGGMGNFYKYIAKNYRTPSVQGLSGKVYVTFVIDKDGRIIDPKVLRDLGYGTGEEALRVLKKCENWIPGEQRGRKVRCTFSMPIAINSN
ncbi:energy transducer TonB [Flavobacterium alvei]|uniref:Energy transducer TonB n=2 Tax=Flavobacterium alvei TaxID=2080416 RepID=A0A2S5AGV4_9FLAO|nr:energy transducer TonB [Flavobacterium alvei]